MAGQISSAVHGDSLADILERILDKGLVIAGDVCISIADIELLKIKIRLLVCSVDKAQEIGIDWWKSDPALSSKAHDSAAETALLQKRISELEALVLTGGAVQPLSVPEAGTI
jgi:hypothetical protein